MPVPGDPLARRYSSFDLDLLARRRPGRGQRLAQTMAAVQDGWPLVETALSCVHQGQPLARGRWLLEMAQRSSVEDVARWLWQFDGVDPFDAPAPDLGPAWRAHARHAARPQRDLLRRALVLGADHELNMIGFIGRGLASTGATLAAGLLGAMCALTSSFNGGASPQVEALWDECEDAADPRNVLTRRLEAGLGLPGFNHMSYPGGDPRAAMLLDALETVAPRPPIVDPVRELTGWAPAIDFAYVALRRALGAPRGGGALALQMASRCVGLIAHMLEQRRSGARLMARGRYVGPFP